MEIVKNAVKSFKSNKNSETTLSIRDLFHSVLYKMKKRQIVLLLLVSLWLSNHWSFKENLLIRKIT
jgi:hypothetical protein